MIDLFNYKRRPTVDVKIGDTFLGSNYPIRVQSMTNTDTNDIEASLEQIIPIIDSGADYVRLTTQGIREVESLEKIKNKLRQKGYRTPLIADIHFHANVAEVAANIVEKVRINPGNYVDKVKSFTIHDYTETENAAEIEKIRQKLIPLLSICKKNNTALRLGINHGSLSDRIMSRFGNTPEGMVESCMEFLRICDAENFHEIVISMKSSNTVLMTKAVRLLVEAMDNEGYNYPLHLGVTEAGKGEDGRIKSAVGIGSLLADGLGDTIRVSLSENPQIEVPVGRKLLEYIEKRNGHLPIKATAALSFTNRHLGTTRTGKLGNGQDTVVISDRSFGDLSFDKDNLPDYIYIGKNKPNHNQLNIPFIIDYDYWEPNSNTYPLFKAEMLESACQCNVSTVFIEMYYSDLNTKSIQQISAAKNVVLLIRSSHGNPVGEQRAFIHTLINAQCSSPVVLVQSYDESDFELFQIQAAADFGALLLDGCADGIMLTAQNHDIPPQQLEKCMFSILQASRLRTTKTEYISCPGCGRTLFDLETTIDKVQQATAHLKHLKIAVMGCIVNGVGEMADADYGYVGAARGKVSLYKKKNLIEKNISSEEAVNRLIDLIKINGDWIDPT